jgi:hypothetical protein
VADHGNLRGRDHVFALTFLAMVNAYIASSAGGPGPSADDFIRLAVKQFMYGIYAL